MSIKNEKITPLTAGTKGEAKLRLAGNHQVVQVYSNYEDEYKALRNGVGLIDLSAAGVIKVSGDDHVEFINSIITIDIEFMDIDKAAFSLLLDEEAQVIDLITIYKLEDYILIETSVAKKDLVLKKLQDHESDDLEFLLEDITNDLAIVAFEGPYAWKVAQSIVDFEISSLFFQGVAEASWKNEDIICARIGVTGEYGYKIFLPMEKALDLWNDIYENADDEYHVLAVGKEAVEGAMLEVRQPNVEVESKGLTVLESCFEWLIHFDKDEFIGDSALSDQLETEVSRRTVGFSSKEKLKEKDIVQIENVNVGEVLQTIYNPLEKKYFGLVVLDNDFAVSGLNLEAFNQASDKKVEISTISSPFIVTKSLAVKMN